MGGFRGLRVHVLLWRLTIMTLARVCHDPAQENVATKLLSSANVCSRHDACGLIDMWSPQFCIGIIVRQVSRLSGGGSCRSKENVDSVPVMVLVLEPQYIFFSYIYIYYV